MLSGHAWTIRRHLWGRVARPRFPPSRHYRVSVDDERFGQIELTGRLSQRDANEELLILVHGLGGSGQSAYLEDAARVAWDLHVDCLRLNLRGADHLGHDMFHAGLGHDLDVVLRSPEVSRYRRRYVMGYSLGGHVCLRYAADHPDAFVDAMATVSAPLDLEASAACFDDQPAWPYRAHVLEGMLLMYAAFVARRGPWPLSLERARRLERIRDFDEAIIAPRFGFQDASEYYRHASVSNALARIRTPTLLLHARQDPMVPSACVEPWLRQLPNAMTAMLVSEGGHVAFPPHLSLGQRAPLGLAAQVMAWLRRNGRHS